MEPQKTYTDDGWSIRIHLLIRHCILKDSQLNPQQNQIGGPDFSLL